MELVGTVKEYREADGGLRVVFRCCNKEEFDLRIPPAHKRIPPGQLVRGWTMRDKDELGMPRGDTWLIDVEEF